MILLRIWFLRSRRVYTVPLTVHFGQEEYIDGVTIDNKAFYEKLNRKRCAAYHQSGNSGCFMKEFEKARQAEEAAVVITLASKFSGTYQSAMIAASDYENVYVVDGTSAAMGTGILVELAFRLLDAGMSAEEIARVLEEEKKRSLLLHWWIHSNTSSGAAAFQRQPHSPEGC